MNTTVKLINKESMLRIFAPFIDSQVHKYIDKILDGEPVNATYNQIKKFAKLEDCVDYCIMLTLADHVNYIAVGNTLYSKLYSTSYFAPKSKTEATESLNSVINLLLLNKPSDKNAVQLFDVFMSRQVFGEHTLLIALMLTDIYCKHTAIGVVTGYNGHDGPLIHLV